MNGCKAHQYSSLTLLRVYAPKKQIKPLTFAPSAPHAAAGNPISSLRLISPKTSKMRVMKAAASLSSATLRRSFAFYR